MKKITPTFKTDILFKLLFVKHPELLRRLVAHVLKIPLDGISQFEIKNPEIPPDIMGKKFCRLDINMIVDGQNVNLEVQVENEGDYPERVLYHWARLYSNSLPSGKKYHELPRTIVISILDITQFESSAEYHSEFQILEKVRNESLTDKMVLHFFELSKLPETLDREDMLLLWLALFKANTEEELMQIYELGVPELSEAVNAYHSVTASEEFKELERLRIKASHDEAQALFTAEKRGAETERKKWQLANIQLLEEIDKLKQEIEDLKSS